MDEALFLFEKKEKTASEGRIKLLKPSAIQSQIKSTLANQLCRKQSKMSDKLIQRDNSQFDIENIEFRKLRVDRGVES
jgi:hypothetical protein